jgi:soluble lytic murein transglycosylase
VRDERRSTRAARLRRLLIVVVIIALAVGIALTAHVQPEYPLPPRYQAIIVAQAHEKHLSPALIAAVIYAETKFSPRESSAGAKGLMQILPSTAGYLAHLSGGTTFQTGDLADPKVNIAYGSYYLRYLIDRYGGEKLPAIAAYNAGLRNVDRWVAKARAQDRSLSLANIAFPETRAYVERVLSAEAAYSHTYARQLGLQ